MNDVCIQIRDVLKLRQETENGLWAESAEHIADRYYEEDGQGKTRTRIEQSGDMSS